MLETVNRVRELIQQRAPAHYRVKVRLKPQKNIQLRVLYSAIIIIVQSTEMPSIA